MNTNYYATNGSFYCKSTKNCYQNEIECKTNKRSGMWKSIRSVLNKNHKPSLPGQLIKC